jgi:hypothetical protein
MPKNCCINSLDGVFIDKFIEIDKFDFYRIYR